MSRINQVLLVAIALLGMIAYSLLQRANRLERERNIYQHNAEALLSDVRRMQIDSTTRAVDVKTLHLTLDEYKRYRAEDVKRIEQMGVRLKSLQSAAKHELAVDVPIKAGIRDSSILRDTVIVKIQTIDMKNPYLRIYGIIENNEITGNIHIPVTIRQAVWAEHKHKFLWWSWGIKAIHQTISSDNPYVEVKYSEMVQLNSEF